MWLIPVAGKYGAALCGAEILLIDQGTDGTWKYSQPHP